MNTHNTINAKEIRNDLVGFLSRIKSGRPLTVIYRSKPFVTINSQPVATPSGAPVPGSPVAVNRALDHAKRLRSGRQSVLGNTKSIKELYAETMDEKYGVTG